MHDWYEKWEKHFKAETEKSAALPKGVVKGSKITQDKLDSLSKGLWWKFSLEAESDAKKMEALHQLLKDNNILLHKEAEENEYDYFTIVFHKKNIHQNFLKN